MSLDYIRSHYNVPAVPRMRIKFTWPDYDGNRYATIIGAEGPHLKVRFDDRTIGLLHPDWEVEYLGLPETLDEMTAAQTEAAS